MRPADEAQKGPGGWQITLRMPHAADAPVVTVCAETQGNYCCPQPSSTYFNQTKKLKQELNPPLCHQGTATDRSIREAVCLSLLGTENKGGQRGHSKTAIARTAGDGNI